MSSAPFTSLVSSRARQPHAREEPEPAPRKQGLVKPPGRHNRRRILLGSAVLIVGVAAFALTWTTSERGSEVVVLAHPVTAGQVISASDVGTARVPSDSGLADVPAAQAGTVVGQRAAYAEAAGTVLTPGMLGRSAVPPSGSSLVAVAVKQGQYPPDLAPGANVEVVPGSVTATVTGITPASDGSGAAVVTLQVPAGSASQVAQGQSAALVQLSGAGGS